MLLRRRLLREFSVDEARSFVDPTMGVRGTGVRPREVRWSSEVDDIQRGIVKLLCALTLLGLYCWHGPSPAESTACASYTVA